MKILLYGWLIINLLVFVGLVLADWTIHIGRRPKMGRKDTTGTEQNSSGTEVSSSIRESDPESGMDSNVSQRGSTSSTKHGKPQLHQGTGDIEATRNQD